MTRVPLGLWSLSSLASICRLEHYQTRSDLKEKTTMEKLVHPPNQRLSPNDFWPDMILELKLFYTSTACGACDKCHAMTLTHTTRTPVPQVCWWKTSVIVPSTKMLSYNVSTQSLLCRIAHAVQWRRFAMHTLTGSEVRPFRTLRQRLFKLWLSILGLLSLAVLIPTIFSSHALIQTKRKKVCKDCF